MRKLLKPLLTPLAVALQLVPNGCFAEGSALPGCWQGNKVVQYFSDGSSRQNASSACILEFQAQRILSRCIGPDGEALTEYSYHVAKPGTYVATMSSHNKRPDLIGQTREYDYRVEADKLFIITYPQTTTPKPPTNAIRVESESSRVQCSSSR
jgi:hypothetical protein